MTAPPPPPGAGRRRFWLTVGEIASVLAVVIAGLSYFDAHRNRRREEQQIAAQARSASTLVLAGVADEKGRRVLIAPARQGQLIQSQRYYFPAAVLAHPMEVSAARPQISLDWLSGGLERALDRAGARGAGESQLPVVIATTFVEGGQIRTDRSLYQVGWAWRARFLIGRRLVLQGLALVRHAAPGDPQGELDRRWSAQMAALARP